MILEIISMFVALVALIVSIVFGVKHHELSKKVEKISLYEKRYKVYAAVMELIAGILSTGSISNDDLMNFLEKTKEKEFLFKQEIHTYMDTIYSKSLDLRALIETLEGNVEVDKKQELIDAKYEMIKWFPQQFDIAKEKFRQYLKLAD